MLYRKNFINTIIILVIIIFNILFSLSNSCKLSNIYNKNSPNYYDRYKEIINNYELMEEKYIFIPAQVTNLSLNKINNLFLINKGFKDLVKKNSYVVNELGLVGIIEKVYKDISVVKLINSENINITVEINDCYGTLKNINNKHVIDDLINCHNVSVGDSVFTSKYSVSSSNINIGKVSKINKNKIYIDYNFNPYKIKYLGVIYDSY